MNPNIQSTPAESNSQRKKRLAREHNERNIITGRSIDTLSREEREEMNTLSKDLFGASSRWQKFINKGVHELITEEVTEYVPDDKNPDGEGSTRAIQVPVKLPNGGHITRTKHHTVDSLKAFMISRKAQLDHIRAILKKQQEDALAKKLQEEQNAKVHEKLQGSAL